MYVALPGDLQDPQRFIGSFRHSVEAIFIHDEAHQRETWAARQTNWSFPLNILNLHI